jgi:hypothetical protein
MPTITIADLYKKAQDDAKFNADKAWETIKFCTTISSTLIAVTVSLLGAINAPALAIDLPIKALLTFILIIFPIMVVKIADLTEKNFKRECDRMYESIAILMKIEEELPERRSNQKIHFSGEKTYTPQKWNDEKYRFPCTKQYTESMMKSSDKFHSSMRPVFSILRYVSYALLLTVFLIFLVTIRQFFDITKLLESIFLSFSVPTTAYYDRSSTRRNNAIQET